MRTKDNLVAELNDFLGLGPGGAPTSRIPVLPCFIQSMAEDVPEEDLEYLQSKGVFSLPRSMLCRELLRAFVESVYPFLPVLDLASFLRAVISQDEANNDSQPVSLLLFHAVMFSATAFVDLKHLYKAGYATRKDAREQFYLRARALYDFDVENDRLVLIQALLLMTYWHESPDNPKDSQYWLNVCWSLGASIGLDHNPSGAAISAQTQKVWKRVWWCLYTRDALLALNLRRPLSCQKESSGLSVVGLEDFDIGRHAQRIVAALGGCTLLEDIRVQQNLAVGFIEKAKLCVLIYEVLALRDAQGTTPSSPGLIPPSRCSIEETARRLERWSNELPVRVQYAPLRAEDLDFATTRLLHVQRSWIRVLFLATIGTLHRQGLSSATIHSHGRSSPALNRLHPHYESVANEIPSILQELNQLCLVQHLPTTTVALLVPVLLRQVLVFGTHTGPAQVEAFELFYKAMQVLGTLGDVYSCAGVRWRGGGLS
ncbi:fungal-specific transcription factor domain-containing protein [Aspergillus insuetus]